MSRVRGGVKLLLMISLLVIISIFLMQSCSRKQIFNARGQSSSQVFYLSNFIIKQTRGFLILWKDPLFVYIEEYLRTTLKTEPRFMQK